MPAWMAKKMAIIAPLFTSALCTEQWDFDWCVCVCVGIYAYVCLFASPFWKLLHMLDIIGDFGLSSIETWRTKTENKIKK